ncbi:MAG TPA: hypothetical protein VF843_16170 [Streptosporangiaceae bacterium]
MTRRTRILYGAATLVALVVVASAAVQAARQGSWGPLESVAWAPAVLIAVWPIRGTRCMPARRQPR